MSERPRVLRTIGLAAAALVAIAGCSSSSNPSSTPRTPAATSSRPAAASTSPRPTVKPTPKRLTAAQLRAQAATDVATLAEAEPAGGVSVAELNTTTGASYSAGASAGMRTASAYKLFVLEALLWHEQTDGLSGSQAAQATAAIEHSDNEAGYDLFLAAGGNSGLAAAAAAFGMTHTVPGRSDPTFTTTSAPDYLRLLGNLVGPGALDAGSRAYVLGLMRNVEADQRWGVGVVADPGTDFANKNGWLSIDDTNGPDEADNGLWAVTSVGVVTVHGQTVLMAVFSQHQPSMAAGVTLVQELARAMIPAVAP